MSKLVNQIKAQAQKIVMVDNQKLGLLKLQQIRLAMIQQDEEEK